MDYPTNNGTIFINCAIIRRGDSSQSSRRGVLKSDVSNRVNRVRRIREEIETRRLLNRARSKRDHLGPAPQIKTVERREGLDDPVDGDCARTTEIDHAGFPSLEKKGAPHLGRIRQFERRRARHNCPDNGAIRRPIMEISRADLKQITKEKLGAQCRRGQGSSDARGTSIVNMHKLCRST